MPLVVYDDPRPILHADRRIIETCDGGRAIDAYSLLRSASMFSLFAGNVLFNAAVIQL